VLCCHGEAYAHRGDAGHHWGVGLCARASEIFEQRAPAATDSASQPSDAATKAKPQPNKSTKPTSRVQPPPVAPPSVSTAAPVKSTPGSPSAEQAATPGPKPSAPATASSDSRKGGKVPAHAAVKPPPAVATPPALDLASLEQRLRETHAIGVFTKLSLKNQVDDLLNQFRAHYRSSATTPPSQLRHNYDLLMVKVLSSLQDGDPPLAPRSRPRVRLFGVFCRIQKNLRNFKLRQNSMRKPLFSIVLMIFTAFGSAALVRAEDNSAKDLMATIALHGMPCDQVVGVKRNADSDYNATCKDGNRYHVFVDPQGHVVVQKL